MKTLSLTQPWASLVVSGAKRYETRSWRTAYRGPLAIHAAAGMPPAAVAAAGRFGLELGALPRGAVLGEVMLVDCQPTDEVLVGDQERAYGDYSAGRYAWRLSAPKAYKTPRPARGSLGLWNWSQAEGD